MIALCLTFALLAAAAANGRRGEPYLRSPLEAQLATLCEEVLDGSAGFALPFNALKTLVDETRVLVEELGVQDTYVSHEAFTHHLREEGLPPLLLKEFLILREATTRQVQARFASVHHTLALLAGAPLMFERENQVRRRLQRIILARLRTLSPERLTDPAFAGMLTSLRQLR